MLVPTSYSTDGTPTGEAIDVMTLLPYAAAARFPLNHQMA